MIAWGVSVEGAAQQESQGSGGQESYHNKRLRIPGFQGKTARQLASSARLGYRGAEAEAKKIRV
jgi:hypothetical protein